MIKAYLAQYEVYLWAALALLMLIGGVYEVHRLENIGVQRQQAADAKLAAAQAVHKDEVEKRANELNQAAGGILHAALVAPDPKPAVAVRVCPRAVAARPVVPSNDGAVDRSPGQSAVIQRPVGDESAGGGVDIAPGTESLLKRADAEIAYWRSYYAICKAEGACK